MKKRLVLLLGVLVAAVTVRAQVTFPVNGPQDDRPELYALTNATIYVDYQTKMENATLLIEKGKVKAVGTSVSIPAGAVTYDLAGYTIYPSFVEVFGSYGVPEPKSAPFNWSDPPQYETNTEGPYNWNQAIRSEYSAAENFSVDEKTAGTWRGLGFGTILTHRMDGISRGSGALVTLGESRPHEQVLVENAAHVLSFDKGTSRQAYPSSLMGSIALLRQTYADAKWYGAANPKPFEELSLEAWNQWQGLPQIFTVDSWTDILRADKIGDEFGVRYIVRGGGDEYQRLDAIKAANVDLILPVDFPEAFDVDDPWDARVVSLTDLKHWEMAPANAKMVSEAGINFAFTSDGLKKKGDFLKHVRKAVEYGLSEEMALKALTYTPARMARAESMVGGLQAGKLANLIVTDGNLFEDDTKIYHNWVQGQPFVLTATDKEDYTGLYELSIDGSALGTLQIMGEPGSQKVKFMAEDTTDVKATFDHEKVTMAITVGEGEEAKSYRLSGYQLEQGWKGQGTNESGTWIDWSADYSGAPEEGEDEMAEKTEESSIGQLGELMYPFVAYGNATLPKAQNILIKNATVWTLAGDNPVQENTDVLLQGGKIAQVGRNLSANGAMEVDGTGMHLTPGIIDEHSHIAISNGVNEGSHAVTAEVRIGDVVNSEDVNIYRQLAGGVTTAQLLHGSANPIGGQSALIKLRWGMTPEQMKVAGADGYIKCALGENVKQSNWGDNVDSRFPQTRMGVEQVFVNAFTQARAYEAEWKAYNALSSRDKANTPAPRRDLQMETLVEILNGERFITCHSYVQSEINMLMKVAERFGFRINTFTHILEGYKVADIMAEHGAGGSTFSDWWAYKMEVREAIPYNATLMSGAGVVTAINSDDAEMARRLNQEAAKSVKYGGVSEVEAMKMVTLNPAKLLHLDDRMGSIEVGKDADVVLWTDHPLSIYAMPSKTIIDGVVYYDAETDAAKRAAMDAERARLVDKMLNAGGGKGGRRPSWSPQRAWDCEDVIDYWLLDDQEGGAE